MSTATAGTLTTHCYHCGDVCTGKPVYLDNKSFCCEGCKMVFGILQKEGLCDYYSLNHNPGLSQKQSIRKDKFAFLEDPAIEKKLVSFRNDKEVHVTFYLPQIHCSSCLYLLGHLHQLAIGIRSAKVNFIRKEITIAFLPDQTTLRQVAELLARVGYEPYISLHDLHIKKPRTSKSIIYRLGIAGFCFGNIMLLSFPEYLGIDASDELLRTAFRWMSFGLSIPVLFYAAYPFYAATVQSLRQRVLTIDAPIALAIVITFVRSAWEVLSASGAGYFDSMSGIVFFMLAGRFLQENTYQQLSFDRDYTSYFPVAVSVFKEGKELTTALPDIKSGDTLLLHNEELIPADGILTKGRAIIDYSFVTGESAAVTKEIGELLYAGGRQTGANIEVLVVKDVSQSYLTQLWDRSGRKTRSSASLSFVHLLSKYFTAIVFIIAAITAAYWIYHDTSRIWTSVTSIFIIACPCALLLSNTFVNGSILRILSANGLYLRNAETIEAMAAVTHIVFDKTGTLTSTRLQEISYQGRMLTEIQKTQVAALAACSAHPLSRMLAKKLESTGQLIVDDFSETPGKGVKGTVAGTVIKLGSHSFAGGNGIAATGPVVYVSVDDEWYGYFTITHQYRKKIFTLLQQLKKKFRLAVLSGDNDAEKDRLQQWLGNGEVLFNQQPEDKLAYIQQLQQSGARVMMVGDGLNDAGALTASDIGIAVSEDNNNFTPASDAIMSAEALLALLRFIRLCDANRTIIMCSFILSILYNLVGLYFAVEGNLSPMIAAILMPSSSLCILLITFGSSRWFAKRLHL